MINKYYFTFLIIISVFLYNTSNTVLYSQSDSSKIVQNIDLRIPSLKFSNGQLYKDSAKLRMKIPKQKNHLNPIKFAALTGVTVGMVIGLHNFQRHAWWSGERGQFHIQNDWAYAMSMDKIGHFMEGGLIAKTMEGAFIWSGMDATSAMWFGALFSIGYMTDIEIEDGFATAWGYSPGDEYANLSGDIFSVVRDMWKPLQTVKLKWSYVPTNDPKHKGDFPDDYNGQVFWLSFNMHDYFGGKLQDFWPKYLNLAVGYGVKGYEDSGPGSRTQNIYLGFDFNLTRIIPGESTFMKFLKEFINTFKIIPTPAIKWNTTNGKLQIVIH